MGSVIGSSEKVLASTSEAASYLIRRTMIQRARHYSPEVLEFTEMVIPFLANKHLRKLVLAIIIKQVESALSELVNDRNGNGAGNKNGNDTLP